ncbi:dynein light chain, Tctex-1 domain containing protein [Monocercomonoides exilis]|uniref:dynein light chain, Tctex-1 domain containing protein n=1 Tax=Monocercomonoides exilis TaxID=2049356 RepID=UPI00355A4441|nr:dynein light chain, Tctex-1 domain containing protein [Monocercomonoides exilis]|eukprot:MONOS_11375.1-p1 / transcript=MONOS_11375.1 / gene=MONOS_11375 / organism=Monocercomonoides_exilis_PA203 / gene_product=dynein light chain, Tctex-1 domain containing protein / transcript_product=dynein light chain, Tctex-1 domain containing protein / location=Mono_scaffold00567:36605-37252(-) / protein_length=111 / sequence_SO=supercontig / SO=protein_coding / is_pseudo=false
MELDLGHPFPAEEIREIARETYNSILQPSTEFQNSRLDFWTNSILEGILKKLSMLKHQYKYSVSCVIIQNVGAGVVSSSMCLWDKTTDNFLMEPWSNETIQAYVTVYGFAL